MRAASKGLTSVDEAPASTTVLTQEELRAFGWRTLAEALSGVRGFFLTDDRNYTYVGVRGFSPPGRLQQPHPHPLGWPRDERRVGRPGLRRRMTSVDLESVERIEVVRGPGSALYGTGAFFAVINVVPRESLGTQRRVEVTGSVGALGATRLHAAAGWESGPDRSVMVSLSAMQCLGRGHHPTGSGPERGGTGRRARRERLCTGALRLSHAHGPAPRPGEGHSHRALRHRSGRPGHPGEGPRGFAEARYERPLSEHVTLSLRGAFDLSRYRGYFMYEAEDGSGLRRDTDAGRAEWLSTEARVLLALSETNRLTVGLEGQGQSEWRRRASAQGTACRCPPRRARCSPLPD